MTMRRFLPLVRAALALCTLTGEEHARNLIRGALHERDLMHVSQKEKPPRSTPRPTFSNRLIHGPIVPPAHEDQWPADLEWETHTCTGCGARWQTAPGDVRQTMYGAHEPLAARWSLAIACPVCGDRYWHSVYRFILFSTEKKRRGHPARSWYTDRLTGRVVTYGASGWEEAA